MPSSSSSSTLPQWGSRSFAPSPSPTCPAEIRGTGGIRIIVTSSDAKWRTVSSLLPRPFGPHDLLPKHVPLVLKPHDSPLVGNPATAVITNGFANGDLEACLREAAEAAARAAHALYSECPSRFAVADGEGRVYAGGYAWSPWRIIRH
uniref:Cytidine/deoxycytidylate deaminase zinc-binding domain-containing protein n=1 Tax=Oryza barthii TaxID=65489 RepID=A0A0D3GIM1_9ORYZ